MKAVTWQSERKIRVDDVEDARLQEPTDAVIRITSTAICRSDLYLYERFGPFLAAGDIRGHESMGIVEAIGADVPQIAVGDRVATSRSTARPRCASFSEEAARLHQGRSAPHQHREGCNPMSNNDSTSTDTSSTHPGEDERNRVDQLPTGTADGDSDSEGDTASGGAPEEPDDPAK